MLHDKFRLVVVVVIFIEVYDWKMEIHYYRTVCIVLFATATF